jgi:hypothetical protein
VGAWPAVIAVAVLVAVAAWSLSDAAVEIA